VIASEALAYPRNAMDFDSVMAYGQCIFNICARDFNPNCACGDDSCRRYPWTDCDQPDAECCAQDTIDCCDEDPEACRVLEIIDEGDRALFQEDMGQRDHLSFWDATVMSWVYPQPGWRFMELNYSPSNETGTFHHPYVNVESMLDGAPPGSTILTLPANYARPATAMTKPVTIAAPLGGVVIR
jgi:hypothetical protein